jgi:hypothetical protein
MLVHLATSAGDATGYFAAKKTQKWITILDCYPDTCAVDVDTVVSFHLVPYMSSATSTQPPNPNIFAPDGTVWLKCRLTVEHRYGFVDFRGRCMAAQ